MSRIGDAAWKLPYKKWLGEDGAALICKEENVVAVQMVWQPRATLQLKKT
jgi:hypothetical protein